MQVGGIYEQRDAQSVTYILEDASLFFATGYKVLKSQEGNGFVKCNHLTHNGKDKLVYDIAKYKTLSSLATTVDSVAFLSVFINLLDAIINAKNNGFMQYDNIDLSFDNIYVDVNNYKVYLVYVPIELGIYSNDILFFEERFRYSASNFFENYFQNLDENMLYISNVVTASECRLEDMKQMIYEKLQVVNTQNSQRNIDNVYDNSTYDNVDNQNASINNDRFVSNNQDNRMNMNSMESRRHRNNPMRNSGGSVSETMDISDILKQIRKNGYYDQIGENTCFEDLDGYGNGEMDHRNTNTNPNINNRLNLGGTPGSMSKANANGINNLANSGVIPNIKQYRQGRNTNDRGRNDSRYDDRYDDRYDRGRGPNKDRGYDRYDDRSIDDRNMRRDRGYSRDYDRDRYDDRGRNQDYRRDRGRNDNRRGNTNNRNVGRTINATIRLVSDIDSGELELIIDREEFLIGKNFNVVDGFIPHNEGISRVHCKIIYDRGSYHIVDMGSLNGTYVNGARIPTKSRVPISVGDRIGIANIEFTVETI